jgi:hypothetical protein
MEIIDSVFTPVTMIVDLIYWRGFRDGAMIIGGGMVLYLLAINRGNR